MFFREFLRWVASRVPDVAQDLTYYNADNTQVVEDHGTSSISIIDREGNAVATTSTINQWLGSKRISPTLGILWNDEMVRFRSYLNLLKMENQCLFIFQLNFIIFIYENSRTISPLPTNQMLSDLLLLKQTTSNPARDP